MSNIVMLTSHRDQFSLFTGTSGSIIGYQIAKNGTAIGSFTPSGATIRGQVIAQLYERGTPDFALFLTIDALVGQYFFTSLTINGTTFLSKDSTGYAQDFPLAGQTFWNLGTRTGMISGNSYDVVIE